MSVSTLYLDNTGLIELQGYKNEVTGEFINDASVTCTLIRKSGNDIDGINNPLTLSYESGSDGNYKTFIPAENDLTNGEFLSATILAISTGIQSEFNCTILVQDRKCS